jgi:hypothetical protein
VEFFGGVNAAARAVGRSPSQVVRWRANRRIPSKVQAIIMEGVRKKNWNFTSEDLVLGASAG